VIKTTYVCDRCGLEFPGPLLRIAIRNPDTPMVEYNFDVCQKDMIDILSQFQLPAAAALGKVIQVPAVIVAAAKAVK
jgi:hypothetical protein